MSSRRTSEIATGELTLDPEGSNPTTCALAKLQAYGRRSTAGWLGLRHYYGA
jgi:hypothetical protein